MSGRSLCMSWLHFKKFFFTTELTRTAMVLLCFFRLTSALSIGRHLIQVTRSMIENVSTSLSELCYISTVLQGQQLVLSMHLALCRFLVGAFGGMLGSRFQVACCKIVSQNKQRTRPCQNRPIAHLRVDQSLCFLRLRESFSRFFVPLSSAETCFRPYLVEMQKKFAKESC